MASLAIIDDTALELAVMIDTDTFKPVPLVAAGPDRAALLQAFADSVPFDLTLLNDDTIREGFAQFLAARGVVTQDENTEADIGQVVSADGAGGDDQAALAEHEAIGSTDMPPAQPNDTDTPENPPTATVKARCWNCNGVGFIEFGDDSPTQQCGICHGTGKVEQVVQA